ncbi:hypothetical protein [Fimbriiglobus ruber]|uniref:Uncharacterized protein n=1 Tax=Fimbriiglobus ruber TaxID=1908690 RepID=A0A225DEU3_9BACT|nr:hypothetical protein [Fimbriiglobus ruber]OWK38174.1 hypothetical protein FRUB_07294 [Fimbriiglobus ruber]
MPGVSLTYEQASQLDSVFPTNLGDTVYLVLGHVTHGNIGEEPLCDRPDWGQLVLVPYFEGPDYGISDVSLSYQLPAADLKAGQFDRLEATFGQSQTTEYRTLEGNSVGKEDPLNGAGANETPRLRLPLESVVRLPDPIRGTNSPEISTLLAERDNGLDVCDGVHRVGWPHSPRAAGIFPLIIADGKG